MTHCPAGSAPVTKKGQHPTPTPFRIQPPGAHGIAVPSSPSGLGTLGGIQPNVARNNGYALRNPPLQELDTCLGKSACDNNVNSPEGRCTGAEEEHVSVDEQWRSSYEKHAQRTICLSRLSVATTYSDILNVVKGGMLLDIYLRDPCPSGRIASISFLEESSAREFFSHSTLNGLYIRGKKVFSFLELPWSSLLTISG